MYAFSSLASLLALPPAENETGSRGVEAVARVLDDSRLGAGAHFAGGRRHLRRGEQDGHHLPQPNGG